MKSQEIEASLARQDHLFRETADRLYIIAELLLAVR